MVQQITVQQLAEMLQNGQPVHLLDVRQQKEHAAAALPNSQLIPLDQLPLRYDEVEPPEGATLVVYCHHGIRSLKAANLLAHLGLANVCSLAGGIDAWSQAIDPSIPRYT